MDYREFRRLRTACISNLPPAPPAVLEHAVSRLFDRLSSSNMFALPHVETSDDPERLIVAEVRYRPGAPVAKVSSYLEAIWVTELRVPELGEFNVHTSDGHVELESFTGDRASGYFLTLHLLAEEGRPDDFVTPSSTSAKRAAKRRWFRR